MPESTPTVLSVAFHLTHQCNLRCTYCYTGTKTQHPMSVDVANAGIALVLKEASQSNATHLDITFIGS